jgi:short-subunit dehydrogenase
MSTNQPICTIVGAGEGLGRSLAKKFASEGFDIALISRSESTAEPILEMIQQENTKVTARFIAADVTETKSLESAFSKIQTDWGEVSTLLYTARGEFIAYEPLDLPYEVLEKIFQIEVMGPFVAAKAVLPSMIERQQGHIFFSSATAAFRGSAKYPHYAVGKFGMRALSQSLAKAYAKDGIHVAHMRLDLDLDVPLMRDIYANSDHEPNLVDPDDVAQAFWLTHQQPKTAWSNEVELRPFTEAWTY